MGEVPQSLVESPRAAWHVCSRRSTHHVRHATYLEEADGLGCRGSHAATQHAHHAQVLVAPSKFGFLDSVCCQKVHQKNDVQYRYHFCASQDPRRAGFHKILLNTCCCCHFVATSNVAPCLSGTTKGRGRTWLARSRSRIPENV